MAILAEVGAVTFDVVTEYTPDKSKIVTQDITTDGSYYGSKYRLVGYRSHQTKLVLKKYIQKATVDTQVDKIYAMIGSIQTVKVISGGIQTIYTAKILDANCEDPYPAYGIDATYDSIMTVTFNVEYTR